MSFTDQKPVVTTEKHLKARWGGKGDGSNFRCYLCGHRFQLGDVWRWILSGSGDSFTIDGKEYGLSNLMVCKTCDDEDNAVVIEKWRCMHIEVYTKYWSFVRDL